MYWLFLFAFICLCWWIRNPKYESYESKIRMYCINLPRHKERRDHFYKHYNEMVHQVPLTLVEAVDAKKHKNSELFMNWPGLSNRDVHHNYKGLALSMRKCMMQAKKDGVEWAIICEDDAKLPSSIIFSNIQQKFDESTVVYMDSRNRGGKGVVPGCCMNCVMYHRSVLDYFIRELYPSTSIHLQEYVRGGRSALNDWFIPWLIKKAGIKCSSHPIVGGHDFKSTLKESL